MRRVLVFFATLAVSLGFFVLPASAHAEPYCGIYWGSLDKYNPTYTAGPIYDVRSGRHGCFDRLVVDLNGPVTGYTVGYTDAVYQEGSGYHVPLRGGAALRIGVNAPAYHVEDGVPSYHPPVRSELVDVTGYDTFRQVAWAGSFEGHTTIGLGVRGRLPMRVFTLDGPGGGSRVVVDVAHQW